MCEAPVVRCTTHPSCWPRAITDGPARRGPKPGRRVAIPPSQVDWSRRISLLAFAGEAVFQQVSGRRIPGEAWLQEMPFGALCQGEQKAFRYVTRTVQTVGLAPSPAACGACFSRAPVPVSPRRKNRGERGAATMSSKSANRRQPVNRRQRHARRSPCLCRRSHRAMEESSIAPLSRGTLRQLTAIAARFPRVYNRQSVL